MILPKLATGGIINSKENPVIIEKNKSDFVMPIDEVIKEIIKALNNPDNNPKCFVSLASFDGITVSKTLNGGI